MYWISVAKERYAFKKYPGIKKQLWGGEFWSDGGYIGTVGDGITADIIKTYVEKQGSKEEKEEYGQMKLLDFWIRPDSKATAHPAALQSLSHN